MCHLIGNRILVGTSQLCSALPPKSLSDGDTILQICTLNSIRSMLRCADSIIQNLLLFPEKQLNNHFLLCVSIIITRWKQECIRHFFQNNMEERLLRRDWRTGGTHLPALVPPTLHDTKETAHLWSIHIRHRAVSQVPSERRYRTGRSGMALEINEQEIIKNGAS